MGMTFWERMNQRLLLEGDGKSSMKWIKVFSVRTRSIDPIPTLPDLGYLNPDRKIALLKNYYFPEDQINQAAKDISRGDPAEFSLVNNPKTFFGAKKHCMQEGRFNEREELELWYRSTEVTKKFGADLMFIKEVLEPALGIKPKGYVFNFERAGMAGFYAPVLSLNWAGMYDTLELMEAHNPKQFRWLIAMCNREFLRYPTLESIQERMFQGSGMYKTPARAFQAYYRMAKKDHWFKRYVLRKGRELGLSPVFKERT